MVKNDCFGVRTWGNVTDLEFAVYDRQGHQVFYTQDPSKCWDGSWAGILQGSGGYVYQITANTICGRVFRKAPLY
jgi:gliding motility-associated-like protein